MTDQQMSFVDRLALERVDRDIFSGWCHAGAPLRAFGGQVAAQALVAAGTTIDEGERHVHSLHAYFLRPGRTADPIVYLVDRPHDGRSYTTRRVRAVQYGETIFTLSASFAVPEEGLVHQPEPLDLPSPMDCPPAVFSWLQDANDGEVATLEMRTVDPEAVSQATAGQFDGGIWLRSARLPDDSLTHACALTYCSDLQLAGSALRKHVAPDGSFPRVALASLDHAMWFHDEFRADEWLLFMQGSPVASSGRGLNLGQFWTEDGRMVASAVQESLIRIRRANS